MFHSTERSTKLTGLVREKSNIPNGPRSEEAIKILEQIHEGTGYRIIGYLEGISFDISSYSGGFWYNSDKVHKNGKAEYFVGGEIIAPGSGRSIDFYMEFPENPKKIFLENRETKNKRSNEFYGLEAIMAANVMNHLYRVNGENYYTQRGSWNIFKKGIKASKLF